MVIIIEGIDRVGKTTLANELSSYFNIPIYKKEAETEQQQFDDIYGIMNYASGLGLIKFLCSGITYHKFPLHCIIDRFQWTENVYRTVDRTSIASPLWMEKLEEKMVDYYDDIIMIYVRPTDLEWSERQHGEPLGRHLELFDKLYNRSKLQKVACTFDNRQGVVAKLESLGL